MAPSGSKRVSLLLLRVLTSSERITAEGACKATVMVGIQGKVMDGPWVQGAQYFGERPQGWTSRVRFFLCMGETGHGVQDALCLGRKPTKMGGTGCFGVGGSGVLGVSRPPWSLQGSAAMLPAFTRRTTSSTKMDLQARCG